VDVHSEYGLAATASWDATVKLYDLGAGEVVRTLGPSPDGSHEVMTSGLYSVSFMPTMNGILGCASADRKAYIWNHESGELRCVLEGHEDEVNGLAFHPSQQVAATASDDQTCMIWDVREQAILRRLDQHSKAVYGCTFLGTENQFLVATCSFDHNTRIFDMRHKESQMVVCLQTHADDITGIDYCSSKQLLATGSDDGRISIVDVRQRSLMIQIDTRDTTPDNEVKRVAFSPDGAWVAAACSSGKVIVYNIEESPPRQVAALGGHADCVFDVAWGEAPDGAKILLSASHDHSCGYWKELV